MRGKLGGHYAPARAVLSEINRRASSTPACAARPEISRYITAVLTLLRADTAHVFAAQKSRKAADGVFWPFGTRKSLGRPKAGEENGPAKDRYKKTPRRFGIGVYAGVNR